MRGREYHGAAEMLDWHIERAIKPIVPPLDIDPTPRPEETSLANYERMLGAAILRGEISAGQAYIAIGTYMDWQEAGEPKMVQ